MSCVSLPKCLPVHFIWNKLLANTTRMLRGLITSINTMECTSAHIRLLRICTENIALMWEEIACNKVDLFAKSVIVFGYNILRWKCTFAFITCDMITHSTPIPRLYILSRAPQMLQKNVNHNLNNSSFWFTAGGLEGYRRSVGKVIFNCISESACVWWVRSFRF